MSVSIFKALESAPALYQFRQHREWHAEHGHKFDDEDEMEAFRHFQEWQDRQDNPQTADDARSGYRPNARRADARRIRAAAGPQRNDSVERINRAAGKMKKSFDLIKSEIPKPAATLETVTELSRQALDNAFAQAEAGKLPWSEVQKLEALLNLHGLNPVQFPAKGSR